MEGALGAEGEVSSDDISGSVADSRSHLESVGCGTLTSRASSVAETAREPVIRVTIFVLNRFEYVVIAVIPIAPRRIPIPAVGAFTPELRRGGNYPDTGGCERDAERLDIFNGLLLAPHLDAVFDRGFITVADDGAVIVSGTLDDDARGLLGLDRPLRIGALAAGHRQFLPWHRARVFKRGGDAGRADA